MHVGFEGFQLFLVGNAEMLLFIDNQQAEIGERNAFCKQCVRADDDADFAFRDAALDLCRILGGHHARQLGHLHRQALETLGERAEMLSCEQSGRHHDGHLCAGHGNCECGTQRDLGLAEADIAADEPVHRLSCRQILKNIGNGAKLVVGFGEREAGAELVPRAFRGCHRNGIAHAPFGGNADEFACHVAYTLLHARLARLPACAAQFVERHTLRLAAEAGEKFDVLDGKKQLFAAVVDQPETVMRCGADAKRFQPIIAADAVILVHDEVAFSNFGGLGDKLVGALALAWWPADAFAEQILLADDGEIVGNETAFETERDEADDVAPLCLGGGPLIGRLGADAVLTQKMRDAFARTARPCGNDGTSLLCAPCVGLIGKLLENIVARSGARLGEHNAWAAACIHALCALGCAVWAEGKYRRFREHRIPCGAIEIQQFGG